MEELKAVLFLHVTSGLLASIKIRDDATVELEEGDETAAGLNAQTSLFSV